MEPNREPLFVSKAEASRLLGISIRSLEHLLGRHELPCHRIGRRVLIPNTALLAFANSYRKHTSKNNKEM